MENSGDDGIYSAICEDGDLPERCCPPEFFPFREQTLTLIPFNAQMRARHGDSPSVFVYYRDAEQGGLQMSFFSSRVSFVGYPIETIKVDHGGRPESGIVKIV
jgi:hypothetical protein